MILYQALYCPNHHESSFETISIHKTLKGAENALKEHKKVLYDEWKELRRPIGKEYLIKHKDDWCSCQHWETAEIHIKK